MQKMNLLGEIFGALITVCYNLLGSYSLAIILFTVLTKVILFPVSLWTQHNSIKMVMLMPELNALKINYYGDKDTIAEETQKLYKQRGYHPLASMVPLIIQIFLLMGVISAVQSLLGDSDSVLTVFPIEAGGVTLLMPLAAGLAALMLTLAQNKISPLQREQVKAEKLITGMISVSISLFLGAFVSVGTGIYWIASNLFSILQQVILNAAIPPQKYVDYEALEKSKRELSSIDNLSVGVSKEDKQREKADYKRFFSIVNKHLVFYSESSGFYKYFRAVIEYLLSHSNIVIHYITSDPKDQIFKIAEAQPRIRPYYIGEKRLITLMMKMDADIVVMTMPDLENYHIKRSYVRDDIEYIYLTHGIGSENMTLRRNALANFDTVFSQGDEMTLECQAMEKLNHTKPKHYVEYGFGLLDDLISNYEAMPKVTRERKTILIAPSWQKDNIMDLCIDEILGQLLGKGYQIIVRPHPQYMRHFEAKINALINRYEDRAENELIFEKDFSSNETIYTADLLMTDWSGIAYEYAFSTLKPVLFIDTPMKVMNPDWQKIDIVPFDIEARNLVGKSVSPNALEQLPKTVEDLILNREYYVEKIRAIRERRFFNIGHSGENGGKYILAQLKKKAKREKSPQ